jgi:predicted DNA-binding transcriptional regulator AlpA
MSDLGRTLGGSNMEILTITELAALLKMSKKQIYTMCETRTRNGAMKNYPLPVLKINGNVRFLRKDVDSWLARLVEGETACAAARSKV